MNTLVDEKAPVRARGAIHISADPAAVWEVVSDIGNWPTWNPDVSSATLGGPLAAGSSFTWKAGPGTIHSTLVEVDPPRAIAWTGRTMGIKAVHTWQIHPVDDGVELITEESWAGLMARVLPKTMQKALQRAIDAGLDAARLAVEGRTG